MNLFATPLGNSAWILPEATMERLGWILVHSLWQFLLLAILAQFALNLSKRSSASLRYAILVFTMAACVVAPAATWFYLQADTVRIATSVRIDPIEPEPMESRSSSIGTIAETTIASDVPVAEELAAIHKQPLVESFRSGTESKNWWMNARDSLRPWLMTIVTVWILGVMICAVRPLLSWIAIRRWRRVGTNPANQEVTAMMLRLSERLGVRRNVEILKSQLVHVPLVFGYLRPVILLPASLLTMLPTPQLEAIIAHELAHVRRHDFLVSFIQTIIETLFFYHPAIWWLSHRVRIERENCCDDLVVSVLCNRVEYGKALLAVEESPGFAQALALGARDGSLLTRIQRLAGLEAARRGPIAGVAAMIASGLLIAGTAFMVVSLLFAAGDDKVSLFGKESNGLQVRLIPLSSDVSDETPVLKNVRSSFKRSEDMTFAVQLKNVSREPISLVGIRYGDGYAPETQGKLNTAMLAPHWFEFKFSDMNGKRLSRTPHREFYHGWTGADHASVHVLAPGESLIEVLRPAKFLQPMDYDLLPGKYRVQVLYRGPNDALREFVRKHWPDKPILNAWPHQATSNESDFSIEELSNRTKPEDLIWGKPVEGLQAALEFRLPDDAQGNALIEPGAAVGLQLGITFHLRNVSDKPITFVSETGRQGDHVYVTDETGKEVEVKSAFFSGEPIDVAWKIMPGEVAQLNLLTPGLGSLDRPGKYKVRYTIRFNSRQQKDEKGNIIFPRPGDYDKEVDTGETPLYLHDPKKEVSANGEIQPDSAISANNAKHSAVGVLPNGDTVELTHLATAARSGVTGKRVWWKPDGTLDEEANATEIEPEMIRRIVNDRRLFEIHMSSTNPQPSIHLKTIPLMRLENSAYVDFANENGKPARSLSGQFGPVGNEKQIALKVGVTSEPWGEWQDVGLAGESLSPFDDTQNYADFYRMIKVVSAGRLLSTMLPPPEVVPLLSEKAVSNEKPDANWVSTVATIQWPENHDDLFAFEFRAVGTDGATNYANISTGTDSSGKTQFFFNGDVLREKLTKYQYRLRPYRHWVTFEDVANQADVQTNVRVSVEAVASPKVSSSTITKDDNEKTALEASTPPVTAEASTVRLEVKGKDANGKPVVLMSFEELQRDETTSTVRTTCSGGGSVGSSLFITRGACEIAKARGAAYFAKLKEWEGEDGTWMYLFGFSKNKDIRPVTNENELKSFAVSEYEFLFKDPTDANIDIVPHDQYVKSGFPLDELAGEGVIWNDVQNGLSLGYRITGDEWRILGKEVKVELWVQNHRDKDVKFQDNMRPDAEFGLHVKLMDAKGGVHDSNFWPDDRPPFGFHRLLPPGHAFKVKEFTISLLWPFNDVSRVQGHFFAINLGAYNFQCELELPGFSATGEGGKQLTPAAGEWTGTLTTRGLNVEVIAPDAPAPKPSIESVVVGISKDGELSLDREKIQLDKLKARTARDSKKWFTIKANDDVPYAKVVEVVETLKALGVTNFSFAEARVGDGKYRVANRTGSYKFDEKRRFYVCQPFEHKQWFTVVWPATDGQPAKLLKLYPNVGDQTHGTWAVVWEPGTDVLWWVDDADIGKLTLADPARVIVERKGRKTSFSRDFVLPDGVANEFHRLGFDIGGKLGEGLVIGGPTSRQEILSAEQAGETPLFLRDDDKDVSAPMIEHNSGADIEKTVLDILRKPFIDDPAEGTWKLGAHDTDVHWKLRDVPQRTEVIITLFKVIDRIVPSTMHERRLAMEFLAGADPANLVPRLNKELENAIADPANPFAAYHEIEVLGRMGEHARSSLPLLVKLLDSKDRVAYDAAVNALIIIGARSPDVMNELAKHTDDPTTVYQLGRYGQIARPLGPLFVKLLDSPSKEIHSYAASALVRTGFEEARGLNVLIADVAAGKSEDRCRAATSLAALGSQAASMIPKLRSFENDPDPQVAKSVQEAIVRIEKDDRIFTHAEEATKREAAQEASAALNPQMEFKLRMLGGDEQTPLAGIEIVATEGYGDSQKKFGPFLTDASGTALCKLPQGFYSLHLNSKNELPYLPYEKFWKELPPPGFKWLDLKVTGIGVEKWLGGEKRENGVEPAKSAEELARVTYTLLKPIELVLRAVDIDTGRGIPGAYFYLESAVAEDWAHPIDGANIGASQYRDGVHKFDSNDYKTDADGNFKRFVSDGYLRRPGDSEYGPKYGVWKAPEGYEAVGPNTEVAIDFPKTNQSSVEQIFRFRNTKNSSGEEKRP